VTWTSSCLPGKLYFAGNTRLRIYHNGSGEQGAIGEAWHSEDEVRRKDVEFVSSGNTTTFNVRTSADLLQKRAARGSNGFVEEGPSLFLL
jgi:hypothetical protein